MLPSGSIGSSNGRAQDLAQDLAFAVSEVALFLVNGFNLTENKLESFVVKVSTFPTSTTRHKQRRSKAHHNRSYSFF